jgi:uncharacterized surface protein with fasciclin (FAS1) repeats
MSGAFWSTLSWKTLFRINDLHKSSLFPILSLAEIACGADDFDILCTALKMTGLDELLDGPGPFTVFAPTDDAFHNLLGKHPNDALDELSTDTLTDLLAYHVVADSEIYFDELECKESLEMSNGEKTKT